MSKVFKSFMSMVITAILLASLTAIASAQTPPGYKHESKTVEYSCNAVAKLGPTPILPLNFDVDIFIEGDVPTSVNPGAQFKLLNASATVTVPGDVISVLDNLLGWDEVTGEVTEFIVNSDNLPQSINAAHPTPIPIPVTPVPSSGDLVFTVPGSGGIDVGPFTAGSSGVINISSGDVSAKFVNPSGSLFSVDANCQPKGDSTLTTIPIN